MEKIDGQIKGSEFEKVVAEKINDDIYFINYSSRISGEEIIKKISNYFGEPSFYNKEIIDNILDQGKEWRFEGTFSLKLLKNNQLMLDNRNGRGLKENQNRLLEVIELINSSQS